MAQKVLDGLSGGTSLTRTLAVALEGVMGAAGFPPQGDSDGVFQFGETAGPYSVGLRVIEQYDYSRVFRERNDEVGRACAGDRARPLQMLVWYPAASSVSAPMTVGEYIALWKTETNFRGTNTPVRVMEWAGAMAPALGMQLWAVRNATEAKGQFPLVVYAPSLSSVSWENADLCEFLASNGYVVIASPSMGVRTRNMTQDLAGIGAQAGDISFLIGCSRTFANVDASRVAVVGFSWGGISNLFAAVNDNRINALVALDGSLRNWPGLIRQAGFVHPEQMKIPLLYIAKAEWTLEERERLFTAMQMDGPSVLNAWTCADLVLVQMLGMTHWQFSSMAQRNGEFWEDFDDPEFIDRQKADYDRTDGATAYLWVARYVLQFLNAYLKEDELAKWFLRKSPAEHGAPRHFMEVTYRAAARVPASFAEFRAAIGRQGFNEAETIYSEMERSDPKFQLSEISLAAWAEELIDTDHIAEAITLLRLNVRIRPASATGYAGLARALLLSGGREAAIESYRRSLECNPRNSLVKRKLRELTGMAAGNDQRRGARLHK
jgi:dienelactone hydrolase